jgi:flagella basal body P-ring formation protein FlgA
VIAPIDVIRDGKAMRSLSVPAVVNISSTALTASRKIASGEMISEKDICEGRVETTDISVALMRDPKEIEGKIAKRSFAAGDLLRLDAFTEAPLIRRGDLVNVRLERDGITLTSMARASENGRLGDVIQVKSVDFSSIIKARVTGQSQVSVQ